MSDLKVIIFIVLQFIIYVMNKKTKLKATGIYLLKAQREIECQSGPPCRFFADLTTG